MMRCIGNTWMCTVLIFAAVGCMQIDPNFDSGYSRLFLSKEGARVGESISKVSRNGKWYFAVDIDKDATFGALWNVIEDRWEVAECEWSVKCNGRNDEEPIVEIPMTGRVVVVRGSEDDGGRYRRRVYYVPKVPEPRSCLVRSGG